MPRRSFRMNPCECGCGGYTQRSFCPGHDMRLKGQLLRAAATGDIVAIAELERRGWLRGRSAAARREMGERTFGIEIEWSHNSRCSQNDLLRELLARGIRAEIQGYNHRVQNCWKLITDASCGYELVSPVLAGEDGFEQVRKVSEAMTAAGCQITRQCGLHVHHGARDLSRDEFVRVVEFYTASQDVIDSVLPVSRRASSQPMYCRAWTDREIEYIRTARDCRDAANRQGGRYKTVNLHAYLKYGTIEIRQHSGTIEAEKIINWVKVTQAIIRAAKMNRLPSVASLDEWGQSLELTDETRTYLSNRASGLIRANERRAARSSRVARERADFFSARAR